MAEFDINDIDACLEFTKPSGFRFANAQRRKTKICANCRRSRPLSEYAMTGRFWMDWCRKCREWKCETCSQIFSFCECPDKPKRP